MPTFRYSAYNNDGSRVAGTIEADDMREVPSFLKKRGLFPTEVSPVEAAGLHRVLKVRRNRVSLSQLAVMTRRLATLAGSSVPIFEAISTLHEQEQPGELKLVLARVRDRVAEGASLAKALSGEPRVFSESYTSMVAAGEASGALETILERLADFLEDQDELRSRIITSLAYPVLMVLFGAAVMMFLLAFVVPKIIVVFEQNKAALPLITIILIKASNVIRHGWWGLLLIGAAAAVLWKKALAKENFRRRIDRILLTLPLVRSLLRSLILSRFAKTLGLLLQSGVPIIRALEITSDVVVNRVYRDFFAVSREGLAEGTSLSASLRASPLFPPLLVHMVSVGERTGKLEAMLVKAGSAYDREFRTSIARFMALLEPLLVLGMGVAVGFVVVAVLLPIFQMNQLIK